MESSKENSSFDELLRSKLQEIELEPSTRVWKKISRSDNGSHNGNIFIEIVVIILLSASLFFVEGQIVQSNVNSNRLFRSLSPVELPRIIRSYPAIRQPLYRALKSSSSIAKIITSLNKLNVYVNKSETGIVDKINQDLLKETEKNENLASIEKIQSTKIKENYFRINTLDAASTLEIIDILPFHPVGTTERGNSIPNKIDSPVFKQPEVVKHTIYGGVNCALQNRWIFNQNTYYQFGEHELAYKLGFGYSYGIAVGYEYMRKYGVQLGYVFNSIQGEKYFDVFGGKKYYREIVLHYTKIPLIIKYKMNISNGYNPIYLNYLLGFKYGILTDANVIVNRVNSDIKKRFQKSEFSGVLGVESNFYLSKFMFFSLGVTASLGTNINAHGYWTPGNYGKSHNFLLGMNTGFYYTLGK